jgi:hypothetical protein
MEKKQRKATTLGLEAQDIEAVKAIKEAYGIVSDNQAIILAIRTVARQVQKGERVFPCTP